MRPFKNKPLKLDLLQEERSRVAGRSDALVAEKGVEAALYQISQELEKLASEEDEASLCRMLLYVFESLHLHGRYGGLKPTDLQRLEKLGEGLLMRLGVSPQSSRLSFLHQELQNALAAVALRDGNGFAAAWRVQVGAYLQGYSNPDASPQTLLLVAETALRLQQTKRALLSYELAESLELSPTQAEVCRIGRFKALSLSGRGDEARGLSGLSKSTGDWLPWELAMLDLRKDGDLRPLFNLAAARGAKPDAARQLMLIFLAAASKSKQWTEQVPSTASIKRNAEAALARGTPLYPAYEFAVVLERCHESERPLESRLESLGEALKTTDRLPTIEFELWAWAAATRWLIRNKQPGFADLTMEAYQSRCLALSGGKSNDVLDALGDVEGKTNLHMLGLPATEVQKRIDATQETLQHKPLHAFAEFTKTALAIAALVARGSLRKTLASDERKVEIDGQARREIGAKLVDFLGKRKGALLKVGQIASYLEHGPIADEIRSQFEVLQADVPAMTPEVIRGVFARELGKAPEAIFQTWSDEPIAAGSIGQVHMAELKDGRKVAVKIQYPDIEKMIDLDMRRARILKPFAVAKLPALDFESLIAEIFEHLRLETDYEQELKNMQFFRKAFAQDPDVLIPEPHPALSTRRILTMEFVDGFRLDKFCEIATRDQRDRAGQVIARMVYQSSHKLLVLNTDIQPGNFLFTGGKIAFLDFGCVKRFEPEAGKRRNDLLKALLERQPERLRDLYVEAGFAPSRDLVDAGDVFHMFSLLLQHVLEDDAFRFTPDMSQAIFAAFVDKNPHRAVFRLPADYILPLRIETGLGSVLAKLGATCNWRQLLLDSLYEPGEKRPLPFSQSEHDENQVQEPANERGGQAA